MILVKNPHAFELPETSHVSNLAQSWSLKGPALNSLCVWQRCGGEPSRPLSTHC